jgi:hypothetical protein
MANRNLPALKARLVAKCIVALTQGAKLENRKSYKLHTMLGFVPFVSTLYTRSEYCHCRGLEQSTPKPPLRKGVSGLTPVPRHVAEVWVVEDVEELGSKTKPHAVLLGS